jgi:hypothetical protein
MAGDDQSTRVLIILDPDYGDRLRAVSPGRPIWIELSPANEPVVRALWASQPGQHYRTGITGMKFIPEIAPEENLLAQLATIDLHHGPYSSDTPYAELEVVGCQLTASIRDALIKLGFVHFVALPKGFAAIRNSTKAFGALV